MKQETASEHVTIPAALAGLLACQLAGEVIVAMLRLTFPGTGFPGPVLGMVFLFLWLLWRRRSSKSLDDVSGAILRNLSLLFVPAAVGIIQYGDVLARFGLAVILAVVISTILTLLVTVGVFLAFAKGEEGA